MFPNLATIDTFVEDKADKMVEMLLNRIEHPHSATQKVKLEAKLIVRESIGKSLVGLREIL